MHSIDQFLNLPITEKKRLIERLNKTILPLLPSSCQSHVHAANYENKVLTLIADSPVWAARLRTQHKLIINKLKEQLGLPVSTIQIRFQQPTVTKPKIKKTFPGLSASSATIIQQTADSIEDEALKQALLRLSKRAN